MNIADFAKLDAWKKLIVVEAELSRRLQEETWTQCSSPNTNVYYIDLPNDGEVHKVTVDGNELAEKFNIADCHSTASTFYYDDNLKRLYVHTSGSDSPATLDASEPKYSVIAFFNEFFSNRPTQLQPYEDVLKDKNGGFEWWESPGSAEEWEETTTGSSTINREGTETDGDHSAFACRFDIDASDNMVTESINLTLPPGRKAEIRIRFKSSALGKRGRFVFRDSGTNVYLNTSGEWQAGWAGHNLPDSTEYITHEFEFITHPAYSSYILSFQDQLAANSSLYFDNVEVRRYRRMVDCKTFLGLDSIPSVRQSVGDYYRPDEQIQFGTIKFQNKNGWFYDRQLSNGYLWHDRYMTLFVGKEGDKYEDLTQFFSGISRELNIGKECELSVEDERTLLSKLPVDHFDESTYPTIEEAWRGKRIPLLLGEVHDLQPPQIDTENKKFKVSKAVFNRKVEYTWYLNENCSSLSGWTEVNYGNGNTSQVAFQGKSCFMHDLWIEDVFPENCYTRIYRDVGTLPDSFTFEIKLFHEKSFGPVNENKHINIDIWNGSINFQARIDSNSIDIFDGVAWNATSITNSENTFYVYKFVIDGSTPGSEKVDIYRNEYLVASNKDCSNASAANDGKIQIQYNGNEETRTIHYCDYIRAYVINIIEAGTTYGIQSIDAVKKNGTALTPSTDYSVDLNNGEFTLSCALSSGDVITCDAKGLKCDLITNGSGTPAYSDFIGDWVYFLYYKLNGIKRSKIDLPTILGLRNNRKIYCGRWIADEISSIDELIKWKKSNVFQSFTTLEGMHTFPYYKAEVQSNAPHFYNEDFVSEPKVYEDTKQCFKTVTVKSKYLPCSSYYQFSEVASNNATEWEHNINAEIKFETILSTQYQAQEVRDNYLTMLKKPPKVIEVPIKNHAALALNPLDKAYFTYKHMDEEGNEVVKLNEDVFRLLVLDKNVNTGITRVYGILDDADFFWSIT